MTEPRWGLYEWMVSYLHESSDFALFTAEMDARAFAEMSMKADGRQYVVERIERDCGDPT